MIRRSILVVFLGLLFSGGVSAQTITGYVYNDANFNGVFDAREVGIPNVPVSDGAHFVHTDANGFYEITVTIDPQLADGGWPVISVSWPTGKWPTNLWWRNTEQIGGSNTYNFGLRDDKQSLPFTFVHATDSHVWRGGKDKFRQFRSDVNDMTGYLKFAFLTGDLIDVPDRQPPSTVRPQLLFFNEQTKNFPVELFCTLGNHDIIGVGADGIQGNWDANDPNYALRFYTRDVGPLRYSFNYAGIHFVGIDWLVRNESGRWSWGVPLIAQNWLTEDLDLLPQGTRILLFMHYPTTISNAVQQYGVKHIFVGHVHCPGMFTYGGATVTQGGTISRIMGRDCPYPVGYDIVHVTENNVTTRYRALGSPYVRHIEGDFNGDCVVDLVDFAMVASAWLTKPGVVGLKASPPPQTAWPAPSGVPVAGHAHRRWGFPCCIRSPSARMPLPLPRQD